MQITKRFIGETIELKVEGRLDVYWADHLAAAVDQEIRQDRTTFGWIFHLYPS